jgi:hypothetical protein
MNHVGIGNPKEAPPGPKDVEDPPIPVAEFSLEKRDLSLPQAKEEFMEKSTPLPAAATKSTGDKMKDETLHPPEPVVVKPTPKNRSGKVAAVLKAKKPPKKFLPKKK